ncbi:MAG: FosX/FosE/FosI family fosfomycin resistance hydrolase [Solirubrobacterales bacterium]
MIQGISHITLVVSDLERMTVFLTAIFEAEEIYASEEETFSISREKFFLVNGLWLCIMEGEPLAERTYNHIAFQIEDADFERYDARVKALGVDLKPSRPRLEAEARSLYFYDYDNHLFELHTGNLETRLERYRRGFANT